MPPMQTTQYDLIVIGAGPAGMMAAITAARNGVGVLLLEKLSRPGAKLKATGGGRCNLTNTLPDAAFMERFGRNGRFMTPALHEMDHTALRRFFEGIGVASHAPDGYRVFPVGHNSQSIITALETEMERLGVTLVCNSRVRALRLESGRVTGVETENGASFDAPAVIIAAGGLGYPQLGAEGDGYAMAQETGHRIEPLAPAMMPLHTKERWVAACRADTIADARIRVNLKKAKNLKASGDLIFTKTGIRGPVVLDFAREITPLLERYGEVPLLVNLCKGLDEDAILKHFKTAGSERGTAETLSDLLPRSVALELCALCGADPEARFSKLPGSVRDLLVRTAAWTPLTVTGHDGFAMAMITRGGVSLKEIDPETLQSKRVSGLYFCGEVVDLDGPCGGYNLQWSFSSGRLAGLLKGANRTGTEV